MPNISYCPCCGYDFRNKNWQKEINKHMERYDQRTQQMLKRIVKSSAEYTKIFPKDVYMFLQGISVVDKRSVVEGGRTFLRKKSYHTKGLNYCKYIMINLEKNEDEIRERLQKSIGGRSVELK